jgi:hypothetical protein
MGRFMWNEVLKVKPQLDSGDLNRMENQLSGRFGRVAKKFGAGLKSAIIGGGIAALAIGVIDKILNPLKETQDTISRILGQSDDIVTSARQFETTAGKYFKLQQLAKSTGLDEESLKMMLGKFQVALAEERAKKKGEPKGTLQQFVGEKDTAEAFFQFAQALQKAPKDKQVLVQKEIFGERMMGRAAEFFQVDYAKQFKAMGAKGSEYYTPGLEKMGDLSDLKDVLEAGRTLQDIANKSKLVNKNMVMEMARGEKIKLEKEDAQIKSYEDLKAAAIAGQKIQLATEEILLTLTKNIPAALDWADRMEQKIFSALDTIMGWGDVLNKIGDSRLIRGIFK